MKSTSKRYSIAGLFDAVRSKDADRSCPEQQITSMISPCCNPFGRSAEEGCDVYSKQYPLPLTLVNGLLKEKVLKAIKNRLTRFASNSCTADQSAIRVIRFNS